MDSLPPLQLSLVRRGWSCILDVRLALAPLGPLLALRLAEELPVCMGPTMWEMLDQTAYFAADPEAMFTDPLLPEGYPRGFFDGPALAQWERTRELEGLSSRGIYWAADALAQSSFPKEVDALVLRRFDAFGERLEVRLHEARPELRAVASLPLMEGSISALALAAAMTRYRPRVLSLSAPDPTEPPPLCRLLTQCGIPARRLDEDESRGTRQALAPLLVHTGVMDLLWAGLPVIAVHLVVPRGLDLMPAAEEPEHLGQLDLTDEADPAAGGWDWQDASAYWYPLP